MKNKYLFVFVPIVLLGLFLVGRFMIRRYALGYVNRQIGKWEEEIYQRFDDDFIVRQTSDYLAEVDKIFCVELAESGESVFCEQDLLYYDQQAFVFALNQSGLEHFSELGITNQTDNYLYQKEFVAKFGQTELFRGHFWSGLSSLSQDGIVLLDVLMLDNEHNTLALYSGYPGIELKAKDEALVNSADLIDHFRALGIVE